MHIKQKFRLLGLGLALVLVAAVTQQNNVSAMSPVYGHVLDDGVSNVKVWLDYSTGVGYWETYIRNGANNWMYPGWSNPIYMNIVSSNYGSDIDFYRKSQQQFNNMGWGGQAAVALHYVPGVRVSAYDSDWDYAAIHINHDAYASSNMSNEAALGCTIHEYGHALGLTENNSNPYSVMSQARQVTRVQYEDNQAINYLY